MCPRTTSTPKTTTCPKATPCPKIPPCPKVHPFFSSSICPKPTPCPSYTPLPCPTTTPCPKIPPCPKATPFFSPTISSKPTPCPTPRPCSLLDCPKWLHWTNKWPNCPEKCPVCSEVPELPGKTQPTKLAQKYKFGFGSEVSTDYWLKRLLSYNKFILDNSLSRATAEREA